MVWVENVLYLFGGDHSSVDHTTYWSFIEIVVQGCEWKLSWYLLPHTASTQIVCVWVNWFLGGEMFHPVPRLEAVSFRSVRFGRSTCTNATGVGSAGWLSFRCWGNIPSQKFTVEFCRSPRQVLFLSSDGEWVVGWLTSERQSRAEIIV